MKTTAKMGRPEKAPEERRENILKVCLTDEERDQLDHAADGKTSTWARSLLLRAAKRQRDLGGEKGNRTRTSQRSPSNRL